MTWIDVLIFVVLTGAFLLGFKDGFFKKVFGLIGFMVGFVGALKFMADLGPVYQGILGFEKETSAILAFFSIFLAAVVVQNLIYRWYGKGRGDTISVRSRMAGAIIGAAEGAVTVSLLLVLMGVWETPSDETKRESPLYRPFMKVAPAVFNASTSWMPESRKFFDEIKDQFEHLSPSR